MGIIVAFVILGGVFLGHVMSPVVWMRLILPRFKKHGTKNQKVFVSGIRVLFLMLYLPIGFS